YEQFYTDIDQVTEEMTQRFEFEVDTTHANVNWEAEVAENMRIKAAEKAAAENSAAEKSTQEA
ncbi:MAG: 3-ketosteroid-9-alpha-hydroxylase, partial [Mycobacteriaceae bacterium]